MIPRIFEGAACAIVAGGPSLSGSDFSRFSAPNVIAINRAHAVLPQARVLWWTDAAFWRRERDALAAHGAPHKATSDMGYHADLKAVGEIAEVYKLTGIAGFDPDPACLRHGNNSAFAAIHLAVHLGAKRIVLFGVDMKLGQGGRTHFHDGYASQLRQHTLTVQMLPHFASLKKPLAKMGVEVINASPDSALQVWRRVSIDEGLKALEHT